MSDGQEILRTVIQSVDVGTPGAGLLSPEQFAAFLRLAETNHPWAQLQDMVKRKAFTGTLNRMSFGNSVIRPATEATASGNYLKPTYSHVAYAQVKGTVQFADSYETRDQAAEADHERTLVDGFTEAFGRSLQELLWLGDTLSADPMYVMNDGWRKLITNGGNSTNGAAINGGDLAPDHFYAALRSLPIAWQQRRNELRWGIGVVHHAILEEFLTGRATGFGDGVLTMGADGVPKLLGIPLVMVPSLTTDIVLCAPKNTTLIMSDRAFTLEKIDQGLEVRTADIVVWVGHFHSDAIVKELEGTAIVHTINAT